jgi:mannose-1-phosphate guanylyltransferase/mannose-6-phosphate isomerase
VFAVVLAGGAGTRLWPAARPDRPKQFLPLLGRESLFQQALRRVVPLVGRSRVLVVAGARHAAWVRRQAPDVPPGRILLEEIGRNTAASIALAALWITQHHGDAIMVVLPSDHWIHPATAFRSTLRAGIDAVRRTGRMLTIGVEARSAEAGFGYILPAGTAGGRGARRVARFIEKPDFERARRLARSGRYLWNSGIFVWRATTILERLGRHVPAVTRPLERWVARRRRSSWRIPGAVLRRVPAEPIDRAVLERSRDLLVVRAGFRWSDLGNWSSLGVRLRKDRDGNAAIGRLESAGASGCVAVNRGGVTALVGVRDLVVVREGSAVLVGSLGAAQRVREIARRVAAARRRRIGWARP